MIEADEGRTEVIIDKDAYRQKVKTFVQEKNFIKIHKN
jgi:broad-specificity NMP kinase